MSQDKDKPTTSSSPRTELPTAEQIVDDQFQVLVARGIPPFDAKEMIYKALQRGELPINLHIEAGARSCVRIRQATPDELRDQQKGKELSYLYEHSPPGGITQSVDPQSWGTVLALAIRDNHLLIEPRCALDFPWQAYKEPPEALKPQPEPSLATPRVLKPLPSEQPDDIGDEAWVIAQAVVELIELRLAGKLTWSGHTRKKGAKRRRSSIPLLDLVENHLKRSEGDVISSTYFAAIKWLRESPNGPRITIPGVRAVRRRS